MTTPVPAARAAKGPKAAEQIASVLRHEIVTGVVQDGDRLGSGQQLLERFGVSRPTLREAFRILEAESLIEILRGARGGVVARRPDERHTLRAMAVLLESRAVSLADVYEARTIIEPPAVRRIAQARNRKAVVKRLRELVDGQDAAIGDPVAYAALNVEFHERLVEGSGNQTLVLLAEVLHDLVANAVTKLMALDTEAQGIARRRRGLKAQLHLLDLIEVGQPDEAEAFWRDHMEKVADIMLRSGGPEPVDHTDVGSFPTP